MSYAAWSRQNFMRPMFPIRAWRSLLLHLKCASFNRRHHSKNQPERIP